MKRIIIFIVCISIMFLILNPPTDVSASEISFDDENQNVDIASSGDDPNEGSENWFDISVTDGVPILEHSVDYSIIPNLLKCVEPGDILYETNTNSGIVNHVALVYDILYSSDFDQFYIVVIEAVEFGVKFGLLSPNRLTERDSYI